MWSFVIAFFGGLYIWIRLIYEAASKASFDEWCARVDKQFEEILYKGEELSLYHNKLEDLEYCRERIKCIHSELVEVFQDENYLETHFVEKPYTIIPIMHTDFGIASHILASLEGKVLQRARHGYEVTGKEERREMIKRACRIIERNIQKTHPDLRLYYDTEQDLLCWNFLIRCVDEEVKKGTLLKEW